jgi:hypothetical protein
MTTPYAVSTNIGSVSYDNYVNAPITGPLSTNQTPCQIPYHSYGVLPGIRPTPPQFYPSQEPVYADMNSNARQRYLRTAVSNKDLQRQIALAKASEPITHVIYSSQRQVAVSSHTNYIPPIPSSMYNDILKTNSVGQKAYKIGLPFHANTGTKDFYPTQIGSYTRHVIKRARSGGCVAPKKKGAIQNYSLSNGATCGWGSIVRQNY